MALGSGRPKSLQGGLNAAGFFVLLFAATAQAQIVRDNTVGTLVGHTGNNWSITGGTQVGGNLFQSFSQFSVPTNNIATFSGASSVHNVIGRVTGPDLSSIDGTLRSTIPGANLWLINPRGVAFGPNANLDLSGSFHVSTANYLKLGTSGRFDATNPAVSTLTSAAPSAFGFLGPTVAPISVDGFLEVRDGKTLSLIGGDLTFSGAAVLFPGLTATGGRINLASVRSSGEIALKADSLSASAGMALGNITLDDYVYIDVSGTFSIPAGSVYIRGGNLSLSGASLLADNESARPGAGIHVDLSGTLSMNGSSIFSQAFGRGGASDIHINVGRLAMQYSSIDSSSYDAGPSGQLRVIAGNSMQLQGSSIASDAYWRGRAGAVYVSSPLISLSDTAFISSTAQTGSTGAAGSIDIAARSLEVSSGSFIAANTWGRGAGGNISINASDSVLLTGASTGVRANTIGSATGNAGSVSLATPSLQIKDHASIQSGTETAGNGGDVLLDVGRLEMSSGGNVMISTGYGSGNGGTLRVNASESVTMTGDGFDNGGAARLVASSAFGSTGRAGNIIISSPVVTLSDYASMESATFTSGRGGDISINTGRLNLINGGFIAASSCGFGYSGACGSGNGGHIAINASESITMSGISGDGNPSAIFADSYASATGNAGSVSVATPLLRMSDGAFVQSATFTSGQGGDVQIDVGRLAMTGGAIIDAATVGSGNAGTVSIRASESIAMSGADAGGAATRITALATSSSSGNAGTVLVSSPSIDLANGAYISSSASSIGSGGDVTVNADRLSLSSGAAVTATTRGFAPGGSIGVLASTVTLNDGARITTESSGIGNAGSIRVVALDSLQITNGAGISSSATSGDGGNIVIQAGSLLYMKDGKITTSVNTSTGSGGNITIDPTFVVLDDAQIIARAAQGRGGNINIVSDFFLNSGGTVDASSDKGVSGSVQINSPNVNVGSGVVVLGTSYLDASSLIRASCAARAGRAEANSFIAGGRGGLAVSPESMWMTSQTLPVAQVGKLIVADTGCR